MSLPKHQESGNGKGEAQDRYADPNNGEKAEGVDHSGLDGLRGSADVHQTGIVGEMVASTCGLTVLIRNQLAAILHPVATPL